MRTNARNFCEILASIIQSVKLSFYILRRVSMSAIFGILCIQLSTSTTLLAGGVSLTGMHLHLKAYQISRHGSNILLSQPRPVCSMPDVEHRKNGVDEMHST